MALERLLVPMAGLLVGVSANVDRVRAATSDDLFEVGVVAFRYDASPGRPEIADLNADGLGDLVVPGSRHGVVSVALGTDTGGFEPRTEFSVGGSVSSELAVGDINGDGHLDVVVEGWSSIGVLVGTGDGLLSAVDPIAYPTPRPRFVQLTDLNSDSHLDIVAVDETTDVVSVLVNDGTGSFSMAYQSAVGGNPSYLVSVDLNRDGTPDIVVVNSADNDLSILLGNGDGTLGTESRLGVGQSPFAVAAADVNGDTILDLLVSNRVAGTVSVLLGDGEGGFPTATEIPAGAEPTDLCTADLDLDGDLDVVLTLGTGLGILHGSGAGSFGAPILIPGVPHWDVIESPAVSGDVAADFLILTTYSILVAHGDGHGGIHLPNRYEMPYSLAWTSCAADWDGDGMQDLAVGCSPAAIFLLRGLGNGRFEEVGVLGTDAGRPVELEAADFNGDGHLDLVSTNQDTDNLSVFLGNGDLTFENPNRYGTYESPDHMIAVDLTDDNVIDLAVTCGEDDRVAIHIGRPDGTFEPPVAYRVGDHPNHVDCADLNLDGALDLVVSNGATLFREISLLLGNGDGTFQAERRLPGDYSMEAIVAEDFSSDGVPDLTVLHDNADGYITLRLGNGDGTFQSPSVIRGLGYAPTELAITDVNADGRDDLLVGAYTNGVVSVLLAEGDGSFQGPHWFYATGNRVQAIEMIDANGDRFPDLVATELSASGPDAVYVLQNQLSECRADLTGDDVLDTRDFVAFLDAWASDDVLADWDNNGVIDTRDFTAYLNDWAAGC